MKFLYSLFFLGLFTYAFSQTKIDKNKRKLFYQEYNDKSYNPDKFLQRAQNMLNYAQTDYEKGIAYTQLGNYTYGQGNFVESVNLLQKADSLVKKKDSLQIRAETLYTLIISYRRAGLIVESDETWKLSKELDKKLDPYIRAGNELHVQAKIHDIDENYCKAADTRQKFIQHINNPPTPDFFGKINVDYNDRFNFSMLVQVSYEQIKCGRISDAKETIAKTEDILKNIKTKLPISLHEFYLLSKALINVKEGNVVEARKNFDLAYSQPNIDKIVIKQILQDRLDANIDTAEEQLKFSKIINDITNSQIAVTKLLTVKETAVDKNDIEIKNKKIKFNLVISVIVIILLTVGIRFIYQEKNKRIKLRYKEIIRNLENSEIRMIDSPKSQPIDAVKEKITIGEETEKEILKKLEAFEKKKLYTTKGISVAQMSVMLKTNTKYLNFIIKEYRDSDFNNYINTQRINYIVKELHDNPQLLQYKISVLADMCGYNSHSQFGNIFKSVMNISPSQYISLLAEDRQNQS